MQLEVGLDDGVGHVGAVTVCLQRHLNTTGKALIYKAFLLVYN